MPTVSATPGHFDARPVAEGRRDALARVHLVPEPVVVRKVSAALVVRTCVHLHVAEQVVSHVCLLVIILHAVGARYVLRPYDHLAAPALSPALLWRRGGEPNMCLAPTICLHALSVNANLLHSQWTGPGRAQFCVTCIPAPSSLGIPCRRSS